MRRLNAHYLKSQSAGNVHVFLDRDLVLSVFLDHARDPFPDRNCLKPPVDGANYSILEVESAFAGYSSCALAICGDF